MDAPIVADEDTNLYDLYANEESERPDKGLQYESLNIEIERAIATLTSRERDVLRFYFGINGFPLLTLDEIGTKFGLTRERVRQIKEKAIRRLKHGNRSRNLKSYLG